MARSALAALKMDLPDMPSSVKVGEVYKELCSLFPLMKIRDLRHNRAAVTLLEKLVDFLLNNESKKNQSVRDVEMYLNVLADEIAIFEKETFLTSKSDPVDVLTYLMENNGLRQDDLADELGGQSVVSDILRRKRALNATQIKALSRRFNVSPSLFFDV